MNPFNDARSAGRDEAPRARGVILPFDRLSRLETSPRPYRNPSGGVTPPAGTPLDRQRPTCLDVQRLLERARARGVEFWCEHGELRYRAPKGALRAEEIATLRNAKPMVLLLLGSATNRARAGEDTIQHAPLTHSQLAHWNLYRLSERPAIRQLATAVRLRGPLQRAALQQALEALVGRHAALRTQIIVRNGVPAQTIGSHTAYEIETRDLTALPEAAREELLLECMEQFILRPIDVAHEPLFGLQCVQCGPEEHVLIVAMEHMISDARSLNVFVRELFVAYGRCVAGRPVELEALPVAFHEYARRQHETHLTWLTEHGAYWTTRLSGMGRVWFPQETRFPRSGGPRGWAEVPVCLTTDLRQAVQAMCQTRRTTLVMGVLTAYVATLMRVCRVRNLVLPYVIDGRSSARVQNSIGYFASTLYLRVSVTEGDSLEDLLQQLAAEYLSAYEHADASWITAQTPRPDFTRNSAFNWVPEEPQVVGASLTGEESALTSALIPFQHPMLKHIETDAEPSLLLYDRGALVSGAVCYPVSCFTRVGMEAFVTVFLSVLQTLAHRPETRLEDLPRDI